MPAGGVQLNVLLHKDAPRPNERALQAAYPFVRSVTYRAAPDLQRCLNRSRGQLDASCCLAVCGSISSSSSSSRGPDHGEPAGPEGGELLRPITLLITPEDCFHDPLNFVFGLASNTGCLVSTHRLAGDPDFIHKECVHELGHVFGLQHCRVPCVMAFSNSVAEAHEKSAQPCRTCRQRLQGYVAQHLPGSSGA